jgi:membrane fusion protein, adhesin transport system
MNDVEITSEAAGDGARAHAIRPRLVSSILLWLIVGFFVALIAWASLTKIDRTVRGIGRIIPSSQLQTISNLEGGIVEEILVKTGQLVRAGDPLIKLDQTLSNAEFGSGRSSILSLSARIERLRAEVTGSGFLFAANGDVELANQIAIERAVYQSRIAELSSLTGAARARTLAAQRAVDEGLAMASARRAAANAAQAELSAIRPLVEQGIEPRLSLSRALGTAQSTAGEVAAASASVARARASVAESQAAEAQQVQDWRSRSAGELATAKAEFDARRSSLPALADRVRRTVVNAPVAGRINRVMVTTVGGSVSPGSPLVDLVPSNDGLIIEAMISPKDIASVRLDQDAKVSLTAYDSSIYGSMKGKVLSISPDAIVNEKTGESHFLVKVRTNETALISSAGKRLSIGVGMIAEVSLLGDQRSVLSYFLSPLSRVADQAFRE